MTLQHDNIQWIKLDVVLNIHHEQIREHGGYPGIKDKDLLKSALFRPKNQLSYSHEKEITIPLLAAYYAIGIIKNHPFNDGNKRTALVVSELFLIKNGFSLNADNKELVNIFYNLAGELISENEFKTIFIGLCKLN